jgi:hypothetical protein
MEGLLAWLKDPSISRLVFAKNCRLLIREEVLFGVAREHGKELEFLQVKPSPRTTLQGKGFGEGDLIRQALEHSHILGDAEEFVKITGKLYALGGIEGLTGGVSGEFYQGMVGESNGIACSRRLICGVYRNSMATSALGFLRRRMRIPWGAIAAVPAGWIDTRFYRVSRSLYKESLLHSHERVQDALGYTLENAFHDDLDYQEGIRMIRSTPVIIGTSGTFGTTAAEFTPEIRMEAKELAGRLLGKR